jgi:FkbM family methyltransferase
MASLRRVFAALAPAFLSEITRTRRDFARVLNRSSWIDACLPVKRLALEESRLSILPPHLRTPSFVIDVGANEGQWIGSLMELLPVPEVWIFEPNPEAMKICRKRIGARPGVRYFDLALGDTEGHAELHVTPFSVFASLLQPRADFLTKHYCAEAADVILTRRVQISKLDNLVPESRSVDLLKVDVQGFECAVLSGAQGVLRNTRAVLIEVSMQSHYAGDHAFPELWRLMADYGFSFWALSQPYTGPEGESLWADAVFVNSADPQISFPSFLTE